MPAADQWPVHTARTDCWKCSLSPRNSVCRITPETVAAATLLFGWNRVNDVLCYRSHSSTVGSERSAKPG
jgi:hypothetical protein